MFFKFSIALQSGESKFPKWRVMLYILVRSTRFKNHLKFLNLVNQLNILFLIMTN